MFWDQSKNESTSPFGHGRLPVPCLLEQGGTFSNSVPNFVYMGGEMEQGSKTVGEAGIGPGPLEPKRGLSRVGVSLPLLSKLELRRVIAPAIANGRWWGGLSLFIV